jgi:tetratricopeptide (TPR) repeat protein
LSFADAAGSREMVRSQKLRMFRRSPGLAYRYRLHEDIWGPVTANLIKTQQHMGRLEGHITHLASSPVRQADKDICRRDAALWRRMLADDPGDLHALCEQVIHALRWETPEAAAAVGRAVLGILAAMPAGQLRADLRAERAIVAIADSLRPLNAQAALGLLEGWEGRIVGGAYFFVRRAELRAACAQASAAAADFAKSLALARGHVQASFACVRPLVGMARLYGQQGDADTAEACIARALQQDPRDPRTLAALADLSLQTEGTGALEAATQRYVGQYGDCQERQAAFAQSQITYDIAQQTVTDTTQDRKR